VRVTVVGTGYVGLVSGVGLATLGHDVACVDTDPARVASIARGAPPFSEPDLPRLLRAALDAGRLAATGDLAAAMAGSEASIVAVGTPPRGERIDLTAVVRAATDIGRALTGLDRYHVVVVKSTVVPGTTGGAVREALEAGARRRAGSGFGLCMNPEFLREGSAVADFLHPDRIVVGRLDDRSGEVLARLYAGFDCPKLFTSLRAAETIKYTANALLATLVSFSNEVAGLCEALPEVDEETVMRGVHLDRRLTPPGAPAPGILSYLRAGIGFGGSCLPKDVNALRTFARDLGTPTPLLDAVAAVNTARPGRVVARLEAALGGLRGRTVAVLGLAFKPGTDDVRDSPALALIAALAAAGAAVRAHDPMVGAVAELDGAAIAATAAAALDGADAAVVATAWPEFRTLDWAALAGRMRRAVVLDGRGALAGVALPPALTYLRIGAGPGDDAA
jgi:UDPglucose 6-dehydrogenase/GDP-mannose 6-dehydrogenase